MPQHDALFANATWCCFHQRTTSLCLFLPTSVHWATPGMKTLGPRGRLLTLEYKFVQKTAANLLKSFFIPTFLSNLRARIRNGVSTPWRNRSLQFLGSSTHFNEKTTTFFRFSTPKNVTLIQPFFGIHVHSVCWMIYWHTACASKNRSQGCYAGYIGYAFMLVMLDDSNQFWPFFSERQVVEVVFFPFCRTKPLSFWGFLQVL